MSSIWQQGLCLICRGSVQSSTEEINRSLVCHESVAFEFSYLDHGACQIIYKIIGSGDFPRPVTLTTRSVGWIESEVSAWIQSKIEERETVAGALLSLGYH